MVTRRAAQLCNAPIRLQFDAPIKALYTALFSQRIWSLHCFPTSLPLPTVLNFACLYFLCLVPPPNDSDCFTAVSPSYPYPRSHKVPSVSQSAYGLPWQFAYGLKLCLRSHNCVHMHHITTHHAVFTSHIFSSHLVWCEENMCDLLYTNHGITHHTASSCTRHTNLNHC
jgi:hypothetical protein